MYFMARALLSAIWFFCGGLCSGMAQAQEPAAAAAGPAGALTVPEEEPPEAADPFMEEPVDWLVRQLDPDLRPRLDAFLPVGRTHHGIRLPVFFPWPVLLDTEETAAPGKQKARLKSLMECASATRLDDRHIYADKVVLTEYNEDGTLKMKIEMKDAFVNLEMTIIYSNRHVKITTPRMITNAEGMIHDGKTGLTLMEKGTTTKNTELSPGTPGLETAPPSNALEKTDEPESTGAAPQPATTPHNGD